MFTKRIIFLTILTFSLVLGGCSLSDIGVSDIGGQGSNVGDEVGAEVNEGEGEPVAADEQDSQIYRNELYGYEIEIPEGLTVDDSDLGDVTMNSPAVSYVNIEIYESHQNIDLQSFVQDKLLEEFGGLLDAGVIKWNLTDFLDLNAVEVEFENVIGGYTGNLVWLYIPKGDYVYKVAALSDYDEMDQAEFQNKILSTFKFIN